MRYQKKGKANVHECIIWRSFWLRNEPDLAECSSRVGGWAFFFFFLPVIVVSKVILTYGVCGIDSRFTIDVFLVQSDLVFCTHCSTEDER